jgi:hypothetical protein
MNAVGRGSACVRRSSAHGTDSQDLIAVFVTCDGPTYVTRTKGRFLVRPEKRVVRVLTINPSQADDGRD